MKRSLQLDFLRFIGVILVVVHHVPFSDKSSFGKFISVVQTGGWVGVDLFFVLSGYLIAGLMIKEYKTNQSFNLRLFLIRRGFKIYPAYYFFITYQFFYRAYFTDYPQRLNRFFHEVFFIANYEKNNNGHLWSISVEEHFYVLLAIVFVFMIKYKKLTIKTVFIFYLTLLVIGLTCRTYNLITYPKYDFDRDYTRSHIRFDAMFFGVLLAFLTSYKKDFITKLVRHQYRLWFLLICVSFIATNFIYGRYENRIISVVNLAVNPICFGYIMIFLVNYNQAKFLKLIKPLSFIGVYSYSIYLFHMHFLMLSLMLFKPASFGFYAGYVSLALIGGIVVSKCIEYPVLKIREKYFPSGYRQKVS